MIDKKTIEEELIHRLLVYPQNSIAVSQIIKLVDFDFHAKAFETILNAFTAGKEVNHEMQKAGYKATSLYLKYDLNPLFENNTIDQNNISLGIRFDFN